MSAPSPTGTKAPGPARDKEPGALVDARIQRRLSFLPWAPRWLRQRNLQLWVGLAILAVIVLLAAAAPWLTPYSPETQTITNKLQGPSAAHWLGTDHLGRDELTRFLYGARTDLAVTLVAVLIPFTLGSILGAMCGYFGGWFDMVIMRLADIVTAFPFLVLVIALVFALGQGVTSIFVAISIVSWVAYARIVRGETLVLRQREFVDACVTAGFRAPRIIGRHILPNVISQAVVFAMTDIVLNINVIITLSWLGLGIVPPTVDWGVMLSDSEQFMLIGPYHLILVPAIGTVVFSFALSLIGDGLAVKLRAKR
ncbi:MAG: ABC transporter permease [Bifidobacteriaceae bacterium]|jgi:peptide/nickel transport system permease protein|nr:ABC transporter permease [Bifidobacteriaceae bacterium]